MAKRGRSNHMKRLASPKAIPIRDKKARTWITQSSPGPHPKKHSIALSVVLRDILKVASTLGEARQILAHRMVEVDGRVRVEEKFPVGLMDVISFQKSGKHYRILVDKKGRLTIDEVKKDEASKKLLRIVKKHTAPGGKITYTFHDGRNMLGDNHMKVGDSIVVSLPKADMKGHLKRDKGATCLVVEGKHAGTIVKLKDIIKRAGGKPPEALVQHDKDEFITVAKYLFVVDDKFEGAG